MIRKLLVIISLFTSGIYVPIAQGDHQNGGSNESNLCFASSNPTSTNAERLYVSSPSVSFCRTQQSLVEAFISQHCEYIFFGAHTCTGNFTYLGVASNNTYGIGGRGWKYDIEVEGNPDYYIDKYIYAVQLPPETCAAGTHPHPDTGECVSQCISGDANWDNKTAVIDGAELPIYCVGAACEACVKSQTAGENGAAADTYCEISFTNSANVPLIDGTPRIITNDPAPNGNFCDQSDTYGFTDADDSLPPEVDLDGDYETSGLQEDVNYYEDDVDGDGLPNGTPEGYIADPDIDNQGDGNGESDPDIDYDGFPNIGDWDIDGDGIANGSDPDIDNDGILNEYDNDMDGDGQTNDVDLNDDGDGLLDVEDGSPGGITSGDGSGGPGDPPAGGGGDGGSGSGGACEEDPDGINCADEDGQVGSDGDSGWGGSCDEAPQCQEDDNYKCILMQLTYENRCAVALPNNTDFSNSLFTAKSGDDGSEIEQEIDLTGLSFDTGGFLGGDRECIGDVDLNIYGETYTLAFSDWCGIINVIFILVSAIGAFHSYRIVAGVF